MRLAGVIISLALLSMLSNSLLYQLIVIAGSLCGAFHPIKVSPIPQDVIHEGERAFVNARAEKAFCNLGMHQ